MTHFRNENLDYCVKETLTLGGHCRGHSLKQIEAQHCTYVSKNRL